MLLLKNPSIEKKMQNDKKNPQQTLSNLCKVLAKKKLSILYIYTHTYLRKGREFSL